MLRYQLEKFVRDRRKMADTIDVHDLPKEETEFIQRIVEFFRRQEQMKGIKAEKQEKISFASWPLGIKGKLTRKEIYDYL